MQLLVSANLLLRDSVAVDVFAQMSNRVLGIMLASSSAQVKEVEPELREMKCQLAEGAQWEGVQYISVLQARMHKAVYKYI